MDALQHQRGGNVSCAGSVPFLIGSLYMHAWIEGADSYIQYGHIVDHSMRDLIHEDAILYLHISQKYIMGRDAIITYYHSIWKEMKSYVLTSTRIKYSTHDDTLVSIKNEMSVENNQQKIIERQKQREEIFLDYDQDGKITGIEISTQK